MSFRVRMSRSQLFAAILASSLSAKLSLSRPRQIRRLGTRARAIGHIQHGRANALPGGYKCNAHGASCTRCQCASAGSRRLGKVTRIGSGECKRSAGEG